MLRCALLCLAFRPPPNTDLYRKKLFSMRAGDQMLGLVAGVAAVSEKLHHAVDVTGSITCFLFSHRTAQSYAV